MLRGIRDRTVASTYKRLVPDSEGRIHTVLSPDTASFRLSSGGSLLYPSSTNLQNMAKKVAKLDPLYKVRDIFVADEGFELVACDYVGAEAFGCAAYSKDWTYLAQLESMVDTHTDLAKFMFDVTEITPLQRDIGKTIRYASQYAAKVPTITQSLNKEADVTGMYFTMEQVTVLHKKLLLKHPLERWWAETLLELSRNHGVLRNCFGYKRTFRNPDPHEAMKEGLSFYPQSTIAWLMNEALVKVQDLIREQSERFHLLLQIHDELLFQCRPAYIPALVRLVTPIMQRKFTIHGRELFVPIEFKRGQSWGGMKAFDHKEFAA